MPVALISHPACRLHQMGAGHPEQPARIGAITDLLHGRRLYDFLSHHDAYRFFKQMGDLIVTGPTRTNVNDLILALATD